ncbi:hypothetical protein C1H46_031628 [Malus baccata]|uniref:Uncharacterized protein n=1 Tax=Malus baccata TaxID=106549 RepID=A0A540L8I3_MALBA|nr:hypothetical protein C1H46_031628 [Malus baccata]
MFEDKPNVLPPGVKDDCFTLAALEDDLIIFFLQLASSKEDGLGDESRVGLKEDDGDRMTGLAVVRLTKRKGDAKAKGVESSNMVVPRTDVRVKHCTSVAGLRVI